MLANKFWKIILRVLFKVRSEPIRTKHLGYDDMLKNIQMYIFAVLTGKILTACECVHRFYRTLSHRSWKR